jgi:transcriptional regulator with XRE-family HTH domain
MSNKTAGQIFREARLKKGLTQVEAAAKAGLNSNSYAKIERGEQEPSVATVKKVVKALNIDLSEISKALL